MGKTFVALGLAYSILAHLKQSRIEADLAGCYKKVLVLTPNNHALYRKWVREVDEFKRRCVDPRFDSDDLLFTPLRVDRLDDLAVHLRRPGRQPQVIVARMGLFSTEKLLDYDLKRRFTLGVLFRYWGVSFNYENRERLLRGALPHWPNRPDELTSLSVEEDSRLPFSEDQFLALLRSFTGNEGETVDQLLEHCREVAQPFFRNRDEAFLKVERELISIYRLATFRTIQQDFPLLIVDEAHNWKNGPSAGTNGFYQFSQYIAPHVRRALLLTATPFQLRPEEVLELLRVSDFIKPCPTQVESTKRRDRLRDFREQVIRPVLANSEIQSRTFSSAWVKVPKRAQSSELELSWGSPDSISARHQLSELTHRDDVVSNNIGALSQIVAEAVAGTDPDIRQFLREALYLYAYNADLSCKLGKLIIRHRRQTDHRLFRIGNEYVPTNLAALARPDSHILHAAPGLDIQGEAELPHYLLMRCVSEMKGGKGRSSLGSDLTGCYSTLQQSSEGRRVQQSLKDSPTGRLYLDLLFDMVDRRYDAKHPKLSAVVNQVIQHWKSGEKVLIFCVRVNTADRLHDIISERVRKELEAGKKKCLGGEAQLKSLRARLTGRDRDLIGLGLDRVLWSFAWNCRGNRLLLPDEFLLEDDELTELARLSLKFRSDLSGERIDRVFLNRATEHILARRLKGRFKDHKILTAVLDRMIEASWITSPYGLSYEGEQDDESEESSSFDERGCHTKYIAETLDLSPDKVETLADSLRATRERARTQKQIPILDAYAHAPSLWLGDTPQQAWLASSDGSIPHTLTTLHGHLWELTTGSEHADELNQGEGFVFDWHTRALVFQALRRALLRESVLLRLLPERTELHESGWGVLLAKAFFEELPNQHESMAQRIAVFVEDLKAASGKIQDARSARGALYQATRLRDQQFVALVKGGGGNTNDTRDRIFNGFNTPLLPEILVCTQVGQEGIDLHRHCRHVIHYDLAWNPAVLEQRTGRADRIGSKTFREREAARGRKLVSLDIGVPFLAGTYDERMYEELRLRAQTFEVLTGGDFAADHDEQTDDLPKDQLAVSETGSLHLPHAIIEDLRVKLQVWESA